VIGENQGLYRVFPLCIYIYNIIILQTITLPTYIHVHRNITNCSEDLTLYTQSKNTNRNQVRQ